MFLQPRESRRLFRRGTRAGGTGLAFGGRQIAEISSPSLVVGNTEEFPLSILAYGTMIGTGDPAFELLDRERGTTYWVRVVPTPRTARVLIDHHGSPPRG